jgi:hypothetical protein
MRKYLFFVLIILFLVVPFIVFAAEWNWGDPLVICGTSTTPACTLCDIFRLAKIIVQFITTGLFVIAPIFIVMGGIRILIGGAKPDEVQSGKKMITNAIIGIVIALVAWVVLNMIFNELAKAPGDEGIPWPWNKITCVGGGVTEGDGGLEPQEGEYCACEITRYTIKPNKIGSDIKVTKLANKDICKSACVLGNKGNYCPNSSLISLSDSDYKLYCTSKSEAESKQACLTSLTGLQQTDCRVGTICYDSDNACRDAALGTYMSKCNLDGYNFCNAKLKNYSTFCPTGFQKNLCNNSTSKYVLFQWQYESINGMYNISECSNKADQRNSYCRLNCQFGGCVETAADRCNQRSAAGPCLNGYQCQIGVADQIKDASIELKSLLTCMLNKNLPAQAKEISSISDNSDGRCFANWNTQCSSDKDSCSGTCCGHTQCSLHYGGKARQGKGPSACGIGLIDCRDSSYAVDFASATYYDQLTTAATNCAKELWGNGSLGEIWFKNERNHVHIQLDGISEYHGCGKNHD